MKRLVIQGGVIVTPEEVRRADILIQGESISQVGPDIQDRDAEVVDAHDLYIFPGLIDAHVHLRDPGATQKEDWTTGTRAALAGGVTTVLDMPNNLQPTVNLAALEFKRSIARSRAVCDFGLYLGATAENVNEIAQRGHGAVGLKLYMGATTGDLLVDDLATLYHHFERTRLPIVVHAEDNQALQLFGHDPARTKHSQKRPDLCASLAVGRALALAEETGHALHIAHASTRGEVALIKSARQRGVPVTFETSPHHLFLSTEDEDRLGPLGIVNPPLRSPEDVRALWSSLPSCDLIATDHAPHTAAEKQSANPPSGMPGLETTLPLLMTAFGGRRIALQDIARLTSQGPARVFHLANKGQIAPGFDADLVLVRADEEYVLQKPWQTKCNWSPFEGRHARGRITRVVLRGRTVLLDGEILATPGSGREVELQVKPA